MVRAGLASYAAAEKKVITEKTSRFDWGLGKIAEGDALRFLGLQSPRDHTSLNAAILAYAAGEEAMSGVDDASPANALFAHYKRVRLQALLGTKARPEDQAIARIPPPAPLDVRAATLSLKNAFLDDYREGYIGSITNATLDGAPQKLQFYVVTQYQGSSDPQRNIIVLRLQLDPSGFADQASRSADYNACGDMSGQGDKIWLHYGNDSNFNPCVLSKMAPAEAALWEAVMADLPDLVHQRALAGDIAAARVDPLFEMMPLRQ